MKSTASHSRSTRSPALNSPLALLNRYQARLHREYQKLLNTITKIQSDRRAQEVKLQNEANPISEHSTPKLLSISASGTDESVPAPDLRPTYN